MGIVGGTRSDHARLKAGLANAAHAFCSLSRTPETPGHFRAIIREPGLRRIGLIP